MPYVHLLSFFAPIRYDTEDPRELQIREILRAVEPRTVDIGESVYGSGDEHEINTAFAQLPPADLTFLQVVHPRVLGSWGSHGDVADMDLSVLTPAQRAASLSVAAIWLKETLAGRRRDPFYDLLGGDRRGRRWR